MPRDQLLVAPAGEQLPSGWGGSRSGPRPGRKKVILAQVADAGDSAGPSPNRRRWPASLCEQAGPPSIQKAGSVGSMAVGVMSGSGSSSRRSRALGGSQAPIGPGVISSVAAWSSSSAGSAWEMRNVSPLLSCLTGPGCRRPGGGLDVGLVGQQALDQVHRLPYPVGYEPGEQRHVGVGDVVVRDPAHAPVPDRGPCQQVVDARSTWVPSAATAVPSPHAFTTSSSANALTTVAIAALSFFRSMCRLRTIDSCGPTPRRCAGPPRTGRC